MIPMSLISTDMQLTDSAETSRTYRLMTDKIQGYTDDLEALKQSIHKTLHTEKYAYPIYSFSHGIELESLIGKEPAYVQIELKRRIRECLLLDERIRSVESFVFTVSGDEMVCKFEVSSIYGTLTVSKEVSI